MAYKVVIMPPAKRRLDMYVAYTVEILKNPQAAKDILKDARATKGRLLKIAESLPLCDDPVLAEHGYRKISFEKHKFFMVYRISMDEIIVDGMFHELQDYEGIMIAELHLKQ